MLKFKYWSILFILCLPFFLGAQANMQVYVSNAKSDFGRSVGYQLQRAVQEMLEDDYTISAHKNAPLSISPLIKQKGGKMIEAMETVTEESVEVKLAFKNNITKDKGTWIYTFSIRGSGSKKMVSDSLNYHMEEGTWSEEIIAALESFIEASFGEKCASIIEKAEKAHQQEKYQKALRYLDAIPANSSCYGKAEAMLKAYVAAHQTMLCEKNVHESQLLAATGNYQSAVRLLQGIGYDAPCKDEVLKIAKEIGEQRGAEQLIIQLSGPNDPNWYRKKARAIYIGQ